MHVILFDDTTRNNLLPFTHTRAIADIRCGIWTMRERWEHYLKQETGTLTAGYLQTIYANNTGNDNVYINAAVFGTHTLTEAINKLQLGQKLVKGFDIIAIRTGDNVHTDTITAYAAPLPAQYVDEEIHLLKNTWDIFAHNDRAIHEDFKATTHARTSAAIPANVTVSGTHIFIEEGATIQPGCIINAHTGPVYIAAGAEVQEGALIRGPLALCGNAVLKMGSKVYGATTIGPGCKVGGELNNVVFFANSNKAHEGYLGNAVIGEWCNLGADTNCSNLKNNYDEVKVWDEYSSKSVRTGLIFCGLMMGDHSKCGINTMFNTGTIVGVCCNIYGAAFPEKFIPSFSWGGSEKMVPYRPDKALEAAARMMARRGRELTAAEQHMYQQVYENTAVHRQLFIQEQ
jgi:UDP-N-acetylglucosamine diphosphorylase/glucosamine-1-phosphate N-acetyltransferase